MDEAFFEAVGTVVLEAFVRAKQQGGRAVTGVCVICETMLMFVEDPAGVEFVGSVGTNPPCSSHLDPVGAIEWAYNVRGVRWERAG